MQTKLIFGSYRLGWVQFALLLVGLLYAGASSQAATDISAPTAFDELTSSLGCPIPFRNSFYSFLYEQVEVANQLPTTNEFIGRLLSLNNSHLALLPRRDQDTFIANLKALFELHRAESARHENAISKLEFLASAEIGDRSTIAAAGFQARASRLWRNLETSFPNASGCAETSPQVVVSKSAPGSYLGLVEAKKHPVVSGGIKALGVAYQSCEAMTRASLGPDDPDIRGVTITGEYPNSPGRKREITDLTALLQSHPYLSNYKKPNASCFDVLKRPMIYDFGGKPSTSRGYLDFFTNHGGTSVLGIDCSGYVFSALATSGLRLAKNVSIKPAQVHLKNAALYMNPKGNGLTCFETVSFRGTKTIQPGDILASGGHIMIIDTIGDDPFGIRSISREQDCVLANMTSDRFEMTYLQSGSAKGGLGISRIRPKKFLPEDEAPMDQGLRDYAVAACRAKFTGKTVSVRPKEAVLVRHLGTPACLDRRAKLAHEDCIRECRY